jgi:hypothetical protein
MQPWMLEQVAYEHRRDLLAKAEQWRTIPRRPIASPATPDAAVPTAASVARPGLGWLWSGRRTERAICTDAGATTVTPATSR